MISRVCGGFALVFVIFSDPSPLYAQEPTSDYFIGKWGQVSYNREDDLPRMAKIARDYCGDVATVINRASPDTFMMYVTTDLKEVRIFEQGGRTYIVPVDQLGANEGPINGARELRILGPNAFTLRYLEDEANNRYGPNLFVRCKPRKESELEKVRREMQPQQEPGFFVPPGEQAMPQDPAVQDDAAVEPKLHKKKRRHHHKEDNKEQ